MEKFKYEAKIHTHPNSDKSMNKPNYENVPENVDEIAWKSAMLSVSDSKRVASLLSQVKTVECFECEGSVFKGNKRRAAMDFVHNNPLPADFYVWLQDNYELIKK